METPTDDSTPEIGQGFENEAPGNTDELAKEQRRATRERKADERRRNLAAVFGHGPGKIALAVLLLFAVLGGAFGIRMLTNDPVAAEEANSTAQVDSPRAPETMVTVEPISPEEAQRRAGVAAREAEEAAAAGESYQPSFDPLIKGDEPVERTPAAFETRAAEPVEPSTTGFAPSRPAAASSAPPTYSGPSGYAQANTAPTATQYAQPQQPYGGAGQGTAEDEAAKRQREQQLMQQYQQAVQARETYVQGKRDATMKQIEDYIGMQNGQSPLNTLGSYSAASYGASDLQPTSDDESSDVAYAANNANAGQPPLIKAGVAMYATLDSELNTDDSLDVFATIRGGEWDGAKIMGTVQQGPRQVAVNFTVLAPQDERPTMTINAVALREEDLKRGMADDINHHSFSRYTALAVSALMSGYGRAASIVPGTTIVTPAGTTITQQQKPTDEEIRGAAVGEVGVQMSQEVRRGFERPSTYSTPAQRGFVLYFTRDVTGVQSPSATPGTAPAEATPGYAMPMPMPSTSDQGVSTTYGNVQQKPLRNAQGGFQ